MSKKNTKAAQAQAKAKAKAAAKKAAKAAEDAKSPEQKAAEKAEKERRASLVTVKDSNLLASLQADIQRVRQIPNLTKKKLKENIPMWKKALDSLE